MGRHEKKTYLETIKERYQSANKAKKSIILSEFYETCGYHRKYAIRKLNAMPKRRKANANPRLGRPQYDKEKLLPILVEIWQATHQLFSKKLKAALPEWLPHYQSKHQSIDALLSRQLCRLSPATIDRWLAPYRIQTPRRWLSGTKPGTLLKHQTPIKGGP